MNLQEQIRIIKAAAAGKMIKRTYPDGSVVIKDTPEGYEFNFQEVKYEVAK